MLGLADQQVDVVGHHHITDEEIALPHLFQNLQEQVAVEGFSEPRLAMVTTASQKVEIIASVIALQAFPHAFTVKGESRIGARKAKSKSQRVHI